MLIDVIPAFGNATMNEGVKLLDERLRNFVRASSSIASFHCAVEEVILNSIDAQSRSIDIIIDIDNFSFKVSDDGENTLMMLKVLQTH